MTPAEIAVSIMQAHDSISMKCPNVRGATTLLGRCGFRTIKSLGYGTRTWLCAKRKGVSSAYTAVAKWEACQLYVWGPIPTPPGRNLASADVGPCVEVRLPRDVWAWAVEQLGERMGKSERTAGPAIRRAFIRNNSSHIASLPEK